MCPFFFREEAHPIVVQYTARVDRQYLKQNDKMKARNKSVPRLNKSTVLEENARATHQSDESPIERPFLM